QSFPTRPVRVIVPGPPGGAPDVLARILEPKLSEALGQPVIVDNRPGAGGTLGTAVAADSAPDGHTLLLAFAAHAISPSLYRSLKYDPVTAFAPVVLVASVTPVLVVHSSLPVASLQEYVEQSKAKPGSTNWASAGNGTMSHL